MNIVVLIVCIMFTLVVPVHAADEDIYGATGQAVRGASLCAGVTDDANTDLMACRTDPSGYLKVNVASGGFVGSTTPTDAFTNPTDATKSFSLGAGYNGTSWDILRTAYTDGLATTGILGCGLMGWNGTTMDRIDIDANDSVYVNPGATSHDNDNIAILPDNAIVTANIKTATSTVINGAAGDLLSITVGVGATSGTFILYDDADCASLPTAKGTFDASQSGLYYPFDFPFSAGMCVVTNGIADLFVRYRDNP